MVTERGQSRQDQLSKYLNPASRNYQQQIKSLRDVFDTSAGHSNSLHLAQGQIYNQLQGQAQVLAYVDVYFVLGVAAMLMIPTAFLLTKNRPSGERAVMME